MHEGTCRGGPLDGQPLASRKPSGVLLVDRPAGLCWLYEWQPNDGDAGGVFVAREGGQPRPLAEGPADQPGDSRYRAAEEPHWDVVAAPWVGADDPDEPDDEPDGGVV